MFVSNQTLKSRSTSKKGRKFNQGFNWFGYKPGNLERWGIDPDVLIIYVMNAQARLDWLIVVVFIWLLQIFFGQDEEEVQNRTKSIDSLKTALRTQPMRYKSHNAHYFT